MNILVTGGAGFIGSHLIDSLILEEHQVTCIDNLSLGSKDNLNFAFFSKKFDFFEIDLNNKKELSKIFKSHDFDFVYHMAANSDISKGTSLPETDLKNTFLSTVSILNAMREYEVNNIFFPSTSAVYGDTKNKIIEQTNKIPISQYGSAKLASEAFLSSYSYLYGFNVWILRLANIIGTRSTHGVLYDFIKKLKKDKNNLHVLGNGTQSKPYLHISDLIDCIHFIIRNSKLKFNEFNVTSKDTISVKDIAKEVSLMFGDDPKIIFGDEPYGWKGDVPYYDYNIKKLKELGWSPTKTSREAINKTLNEIFKENKK